MAEAKGKQLGRGGIVPVDAFPSNMPLTENRNAVEVEETGGIPIVDRRTNAELRRHPMYAQLQDMFPELQPQPIAEGEQQFPEEDTVKSFDYDMVAFYSGPALKSVAPLPEPKGHDARSAFPTLSFLRVDEEETSRDLALIEHKETQPSVSIEHDTAPEEATTLVDVLEDKKLAAKISARVTTSNIAVKKDDYLKRLETKLAFPDQTAMHIPPGYRLVKQDDVTVNRDRILVRNEVELVRERMINYIDQFKERIMQPNHIFAPVYYRRTRLSGKQPEGKADTQEDNSGSTEMNDGLQDIAEDEEQEAHPFVIPEAKSPLISAAEQLMRRGRPSMISRQVDSRSLSRRLEEQESGHGKKKRKGKKHHEVDHQELIKHMPGSARTAVLFENQVWSAKRDGTVEIRHKGTGQRIKYLKKSFLIFSMCVVGQHIWCGTESGQIVVFDGYSMRQIRTLHLHAGGVYCLTTNAYGVWSGSSDFTVARWGKDMKNEQIYAGHTLAVKCILCFGFVKMWTGSDDNTIRVWDISSGKTLHVLTEHTASVLCMTTTGETVLSGSENGEILMWNVMGEPECLKRIEVDNGSRVNYMQLMGQQLWTVGQAPRIDIWDAKSMDFISSMPAHKSFINAFLTVSLSETRKVWSYSIADDNIAVWKSHMVGPDMYDDYSQKIAEVSVLTEHAMQLQSKLKGETSALEELQERTSIERELLLQEITILIQKLVEAEFWKKDQEAALTMMRKNLGETLSQHDDVLDDLDLFLANKSKAEDIHAMLYDKIKHLELQLTENEASYREEMEKLKEAMTFDRVQFAQEKRTLSLEYSKRQSAELIAMQKKLSGYEAQEAIHEERKSSWKHREEKLKSELESERKERETIQQTYGSEAKLSRALFDANKEMDELRKQLDSAHETIQAKENELIETREQHEQHVAKLSEVDWETKYQQEAQQAREFVEQHEVDVARLEAKNRKLLRQNEKVKIVHNTLLYRLDRAARETKQLQGQLANLLMLDRECQFIPVTAENWPRRNLILEENFTKDLVAARTFAAEISAHCFMNVQKYHVGTPTSLRKEENLATDMSQYYNEDNEDDDDHTESKSDGVMLAMDPAFANLFQAFEGDEEPKGEKRVTFGATATEETVNHFPAAPNEAATADDSVPSSSSSDDDEPPVVRRRISVHQPALQVERPSTSSMGNRSGLGAFADPDAPSMHDIKPDSNAEEENEPADVDDVAEEQSNVTEQKEEDEVMTTKLDEFEVKSLREQNNTLVMQVEVLQEDLNSRKLAHEKEQAHFNSEMARLSAELKDTTKTLKKEIKALKDAPTRSVIPSTPAVKSRKLSEMQEDEERMLKEIAQLKKKNNLSRTRIHELQKEMDDNEEVSSNAIISLREQISLLTERAEQAEYKKLLIVRDTELKHAHEKLRYITNQNHKLQVAQHELMEEKKRVERDLYVETLTLHNQNAQLRLLKDAGRNVPDAEVIEKAVTDELLVQHKSNAPVVDEGDAGAVMLIEKNEELKKKEKTIQDMKRQREQLRRRDQGLSEQVKKLKSALEEARSMLAAQESERQRDAALLAGETPDEMSTRDQVNRLRLALIKMRKREEGFRSQNKDLRATQIRTERVNTSTINTMRAEIGELTAQLTARSDEIKEIKRIKHLELEYGQHARYLSPRHKRPTTSQRPLFHKKQMVPVVVARRRPTRPKRPNTALR